jgi:membrane protein DedA with SNARE-associated domain
VGCIPWVLMLTLAGRAVGDNWEDLQKQLHVVDYALVLAIIAGAVWLVVRQRRRRRRAAIGISPTAASDDPPAAG